MKVRFQAKFDLAKFTSRPLPRDELLVPEATTVREFIGKIGIPPRTPILCSVNGTLQGLDYPLHDGDVLVLSPYMDGG